MIACGQIDIGNAVTYLGSDIAQGALQPDGSTVEPMMDVPGGVEAVLYTAVRSQRSIPHGDPDEHAIPRARIALSGSVNGVDSAAGVWLGSSEHDDGPGGEDFRAFAASAADVVDDVLEVLEVADADAGKGVWVAGEGE
jgi:hypothetical protein